MQYVQTALRALASIQDRYIRLCLLLGMLLWSGYQFLQQPAEPSLNTKTYDTLVRQRWFSPPVDPDILILDIDEASLAYMAEEFGRWPWPRDTLAGMLNWLEAQGAKAVVFDILFSDADQLNKAADASFAQAVAQSKTSYFPVLRLNPENDKVSEIKASQLKGFVSPVVVGAADTTLAVVPPLFESAVATERLGYHNVYADHDGVLRHYRYWEDKDGWRIWSLPARMAQDLKWGLPPQNNPLINWPGERLSHPSIPFKDAWRLSQSRTGQAIDTRFNGKIILIGATASSLFDVKTTPIATIHPGVDILAVTIDNVKNHRYLLQVPPWANLLITLLAIALMFAASAFLPAKRIKWAIVVAPTLLMGVSFATLHWGAWYVDLASAASQAFVFFALLGTVRSYRQNYWSKPPILGLQDLGSQNLGSQGLGTHCHTKAWAIRPSTHLSSTNLLDALTPSSGPLCLQSLVWQRRTNHADIELWLLRIIAPTTALLDAHAKHVAEKLTSLQAQGKVLTITASQSELVKLKTQKNMPLNRWQSVQEIFGFDKLEENFTSQDRVLATQALAGPTL